MKKMKILVVDDEKDIRVSLKEILEEEGYTVLLAETGSQAIALFTRGVDLVLLDIMLENDNGIDVLKNLRKQNPHIPVIMISGQGTVALTAEAFKLGAHEFMEKPLRLIQVRACVRNALEAVTLKHKVSQQEQEKFPRPVYTSKAMKSLYQQTAKLASIQEPVVINGPTGSGKELIAQALHYNGLRRDGPYVVTNAASLPVTLAEDEFFGHEKGAFTGAHSRRIGSLEKADGGSLFLDEIADLDIQVQAKLLRVLETGQFTRLGGNEQITVNVRIIAATHKDLQSLVDQGTFRHDLWYRLCAFVLKVPSLDERREDIPLLSDFFLNNVCLEMDIKKKFSEAARKLLKESNYPGNVRELKHIVTRAAVFSEGNTIDTDVIQYVLSGLTKPQANNRSASETSYWELDFKSAREQFEKDYFTTVLRKSNNNITLTAASIGMAQSNLSRKLKDLGLK